MIKFLSNNLVEGAKITSTSTNAQFPLSNLKHDFRTKVWRSTSNTDILTLDMGAIETVDSIGLVDNWRTGFGVSTVTLEGNGTDEWSSPAFTTTVTLDDKFGIGIKDFTAQAFRFWRVKLTSTLGFCELSYLFIGKATALITNGADYGYVLTNTDLKKQTNTRYGQEYIDDIGTRKTLGNLSFKVLNNDELDKLFEVMDERRTIRPFLLKVGDGSNTFINNENRINGLYKLTTNPSVRAKTVGLWDVSLSLREQM